MKRCPTCGKIFTLDDLLSNPSVVPVGMTSDEEDVPQNIFYFTHEVAECGTTFTVSATLFESALNEPVPSESMRGTPKCPGHCTQIEELSLCRNNCRWAPYRRLLLAMVEGRKKTKSIPDPI